MNSAERNDSTTPGIDFNDAGLLLDEVRKEMGKRIVGQSGLVNGLLTGILAGGHVLVEGVPGLAKTLAVRTLAAVISSDFKRMQFTPDLLPADLTGTMIYHSQTGEFVPRKGPIFANVILADEINRAPAKVQSALLEAMAEGQVTIGEHTYTLPDPFFVMATQNPIEQEGTYRLPEAQLDRFLVKLNVDYPAPSEELSMLNRMVDGHKATLTTVLDSDWVRKIKTVAESITVEEGIRRYIVALVSASRVRDRKKFPIARFIEYGASPRATLAMFRCARIHALFEGRSFVLPEDIKAVAPMVLRHRIVLSYEAEAEQKDADNVIAALLSGVAVP